MSDSKSRHLYKRPGWAVFTLLTLHYHAQCRVHSFGYVISSSQLKLPRGRDVPAPAHPYRRHWLVVFTIPGGRPIRPHVRVNLQWYHMCGVVHITAHYHSVSHDPVSPERWGEQDWLFQCYKDTESLERQSKFPNFPNPGKRDRPKTGPGVFLTGDLI